MQAKDIPERPILEFLAPNPPYKWSFIGSVFEDRDVLRAMPSETPYKVALAKMRSLIKRKLVSGCACGCRGDFEITENGRRWLSEHEG